MSAKNGILIVEFAEQLRRKGRSVVDAAVEAAGIRLRPILMTSLAFVLGVLPLVFATGAGRIARNSVGTAVAGGMLVSTFLNLIFIPVLYVVVRTIVKGGGEEAEDRIGGILEQENRENLLLLSCSLALRRLCPCPSSIRHWRKPAIRGLRPLLGRRLSMGHGLGGCSPARPGEPGCVRRRRARRKHVVRGDRSRDCAGWVMRLRSACRSSGACPQSAAWVDATVRSS